MALTNASDAYFGSYLRFQTADKRAGAAIAGPDNAVGDCGTIAWRLDEEKRQQAWLENRFGHLVGYLDPSDSYKLAIYRAKGWTIRYVLSFTAYSETPAPGVYWGEAAVFAYAPRYADAFDTFVDAFARKAADGSRPNPALGDAGVAAVLADPKKNLPASKVKIPRDNGKTVILKERRSTHDKLLDKARSGNAGCLIASWAALLGLVALAAWIAHGMGLF
ncbi:MAG: hypothetical protein Q4B69_02200 [Slackia sp.]|nr:hypothetical protein [Slackia sp.]